METEIHYLFWSRWSNSSEFVPGPKRRKNIRKWRQGWRILAPFFNNKRPWKQMIVKLRVQLFYSSYSVNILIRNSKMQNKDVLVSCSPLEYIRLMGVYWNRSTRTPLTKSSSWEWWIIYIPKGVLLEENCVFVHLNLMSTFECSIPD